MENQKKEFTKAEIEVIRFEKTDVIATSCSNNQGPKATVPDPFEVEEGTW